MTAVVYHVPTGELVKRCDTLGGAKRSLTALKKRFALNPTAYNWDLKESGNMIAATREDYLASDAYAYSQEMVETINILNPKAGPIMIRRCDKGGPCDPGTERYHTM